MIQDIKPAFYNNHYEAKEPDASAYLMFILDDEVLFRYEDGIIEFPRFGQCDTAGIDVRYLFSIDEQNYFLAFEEKEGDAEKTRTPYGKLVKKLEAEGFSFQNRTRLRAKGNKCEAFGGATAWQIGRWYADNRICGRCGKPLVHDEKERMMRCDHCGNRIYPKICPGVIVAVTNGDKLLLTKYAVGYSRFALVAGFTEAGETVEETVHREVMEEVGLHVKNLQYYKSQPWVFTDTLLFGFFCEVDKDKHIRLDHEELSYAGWKTPEELEEVEDDGESLTREMIRVFREKHRRKIIGR